MTPEQFSTRILAPAASLFPFHDTPQSRALLLAIAGVESAWTSRWQEPVAYARGFWMIQQNCLNDLLAHPASGPLLRQFAAEMEISTGGMFEALAWHDGWAYACGRALLLTDPAPLPAVGDVVKSAVYYRRNWRPGKYDGVRFEDRYAAALAIEGPTVA
jgi:hypothetical protein